MLALQDAWNQPWLRGHMAPRLDLVHETVSPDPCTSNDSLGLSAGPQSPHCSDVICRAPSVLRSNSLV